MRAQNEAPETVVRLVRGEIEGEPTDVPGARRVERVDERALAEGRIWPQSRGSQLAGLAVGSRARRARARPLRRPGRQGDDAGRRGGRRRAARGPRARAGGERPPARRDERPGRQRRRARAAGRSSTASTARSSTRPAPASACSPRGPTCAGARQPLPELQLALLRAAAERVRPGGTVTYSVCTLNADENEAVVDASGLAADDLGAEWPASATRSDRSSCSRHRTATGRPASSSPGFGSEPVDESARNCHTLVSETGWQTSRVPPP